MSEVVELSPAVEASERALAEVRESIERGQSFKLEAGAGAGKTYSLVKALKFLIEREGKRLPRRKQRIACITFTNVAKDEIEARTDRSPIVHCDTIHAFCWSIISGFQIQLRALLPDIGPWAERLEEVGGAGTRRVEYTLGHRGITDDAISIHHDDVLVLKIRLLAYEKFRKILTNRYPIILIDEYQDTDAGWVDAIKEHFLGQEASPLFGFFGDHWQKIYGNGCGELTHPAVREIGKEANFRSVPAVVDCLNRMRPTLPQFVVDPDATGEVYVFHTNGWAGERLTGPHYGGDLPPEAASAALTAVKDHLVQAGWDLSASETKILMLTHRVLAAQQGYTSLPSVFRYNDSFTKKEQPHIAFFVDQLEPACRAFAEKRYGDMFAALGASKKHVLEVADKTRWAESMERLMAIRQSGTVEDVISHLRATHLPQLPDSVERLEQKLEGFDPDGEEEMSRSLKELGELHQVSYQEIVFVTDYLDGHSPFETKHGVKGAEFENVLVIIGRGWNRYNFDEMLTVARDEGSIQRGRRERYEDNRNLFYVACSRPRKRLALLFTQELSDAAMGTIDVWFGAENVAELPIAV